MRHSPLRLLFPTLILVAATVIVGCKEAATPTSPPDVEIIVAVPTDVPIVEEWVGSLDGYVNADIRAQVAGYLQKQAYKEGAPVKKGDLLFQVDPRPFQAILDQARARLEQDKAQAGKADLDVKRYTPLAKDQAISQEELDNAVQAKLAAQAQVKADEAAVEAAQLNLDFTQITSPIDGLAGLALAQMGNLVSLSTGTLTTVSTVDPIKAFFNVNEQSYFGFWRERVNQSQPDLELEMILADGSIYPLKGRLFFADRQVNPNTGTLQMVGLFPNPNLILRPGQYARVRAQTRVHRGAILLPQRAVAEMQGAYQVVIVDGENKARLRPVKVGPQTGANWVIESGITSGDRVIIEGTQKAKEGEPVIPKPFVPRPKN
jgi:membrane fusion protein (multidrug efflux system)